jgi:putative hydrolase of the HAD superfamily
MNKLRPLDILDTSSYNYSIMTIETIVFDIGNVLLRWQPETPVAKIFPDHPDIFGLTKLLFRSEPWNAYNRGTLSLDELEAHYRQTLPEVDMSQWPALMAAIYDSLEPLPGSVELLTELYSQGYPLYCITDNTRDIMAHILAKYDFWHMFGDIITSYDVGILKPNPEIYQTLLTQYSLTPNTTLFLDDWAPNVAGAIAVGMESIHFTTADACRQELPDYGIDI